MTANRPKSAGMTRRHFLGHLTTSAMALPALQFLGAMEAQAQSGKRPLKSCIVLWMGGGPSQLDTWSLKPGSKNAGEFRPIDTVVPGIQICEHLPTIARQMNHLSIVRSLNSNEGNHDRGTYKMHTGYVPNPTVVHPGFGSVLSYELGSKRPNFDLPHCVSINGSPFSAGFLGMTHAPFDVSASGDIPNLKPPAGIEARLARRLALLNMVETNFIAEKRGQEAIDHKEVYDKTYRMMSSRLLKAFDLKSEPESVKEKYGKNSFGQGCLLARKLVEAGVTYVEVSLGGWDNHNNIFDTLKGGNLPTLDKGMGTLIEDLAQRGLLDSTLVVWMGDFGRTPRINQDTGRDHWPNSWSVVLGGGGIKGGQIVGETDKDGVDIIDRPVGVMDLIATMTKAMGIPLDTQYTTPNGRPYWIVEKGEPISELI